MAKITPYKFINPGVIGSSSDPTVRATSTQLLATNRLGKTVEGIANIVADINVNNGALQKFYKTQQIQRTKELRRQRDFEAEARQEAANNKSPSQLKKKAKENERDSDTKDVKKQGGGFLGWIEKFLGPFASIFADLAAIFIAKGATDYLKDEKNRKRISEFFRKAAFVFNAIKKIVEKQVGNIFDGFKALSDPKATFWERLKGLGKMLGGILVLKYLMNPFSLITDIISVIDLAGSFMNKRDKAFNKRLKEHNDRVKKGDTDKPTTTSGGSNTKPVKPAENPGVSSVRRQHGRAAEQAYNNAYQNAIDNGKNPSQAARTAKAKVSKLINNGKIKSQPLPSLNTKTNQALGINKSGNIFKNLGKQNAKLTQRFFLKIIGKGGVQGLTKIMNKIPIIGPLLVFGMNWAAGESIAKSAVMAVGSGLGQLLGGWAGTAIGGALGVASGGLLAPISIPVGGFVGGLLGSVVGEALGGWFIDTITGADGGSGGLGAIGASIVNGAKQLLTGKFWAKIGQGIAEVFGNVVRMLGNVWNMVNAMGQFMGIGTFFDALWKRMGKLAGGIWEIMQMIKNPFSIDFGKLAGLMFEVGKDLASFLIAPGPLVFLWENGIKPFFNNITKLWNDRGKLWDFLTRPGTFQETFGGNKYDPESLAPSTIKKKEEEEARKKLEGKAIGGIVNPTPRTNPSTQPGGYASDTGLDIIGKTGDPIVSPVSGTLEYAERGHVAQMGQDSDPTKPGIQDQHSFRIKLDKPFTYAGKKVNFAYGTHLAALHEGVKDKSGIHIAAGTLMGTMGVANRVPHLHLGLVEDRAQNRFLNFRELKNLFKGVPSTDVSDTSGMLSGSSLSAGPPPEPPKSFGDLIKDFAGDLFNIFGAEKKNDLPSGFDTSLNLNVADRTNLKKALDFSKIYAMDQNALNSSIIPISFGMPEPIYVPMPINSGDKVVNVFQSPLLNK
ncbi:hypothetical protein RW110999_011 [Cyanophage S-RIM4]|nr:hypothetical protein RW110999_011 [Cyanophage S-RIM4]